MIVGASNPVGTGKGINYIGEHAYAYSGTIAADNNNTEMLKFSTGTAYIVAKVQFFELTVSNDNIQHTIEINGEDVITVLSSQTVGVSEPDQWIPILLPPYSNIRVLAKNAQGSGDLDSGVAIVGRVYG
tara:strand:- start:192 stop:578 length:387 start_codon:yes stop_codon:yes gene_type:complete